MKAQFLLAAFTATTLAQGPLIPPGPPGPTMKTLDQIEPRIPMDPARTPGDADALFKITQPGSYYLTGNITGIAGKAGIEISITASGPSVTIDLMGHELVGASGSLEGIVVSVPGVRNVAIRDGTVRGWGRAGISIDNSQNNSLSHLRVDGNGGRGISAMGFSTMTDCTATANGGDGIACAGNLTRCSAFLNVANGIVTASSSSVNDCL